MGEAIGDEVIETLPQVDLGERGGRGGFERLDVGEGLAFGTEERGLAGGGEVAVAEIVDAAGGNQPAVEDDEAREVVALAPQSVNRPRAGAGAALDSGARV